MNENKWINHPGMDALDPIKLELIKNAAAQVNGKRGNSMANVMMTLITSANRRGIRFTPEEISMILDILKDGKTQKEKEQIDTMVKMITNYMKKNH